MKVTHCRAQTVLCCRYITLALCRLVADAFTSSTVDFSMTGLPRPQQDRHTFSWSGCQLDWQGDGENPQGHSAGFVVSGPNDSLNELHHASTWRWSDVKAI